MSQIWIVMLIILLGSRLFTFKWRLVGESYGQLLLYWCYLTNNQPPPHPPRISPFSNNSWQSLLSVPLRLKWRRWIWTSVGLQAQIFAWQSSLAMHFVLNFWAKFGTEVFNKGGGFQTGEKYSTLENVSSYLHSLKYSFTCRAYIQVQLMNERRRWTGRADIYWGFRK